MSGCANCRCSFMGEAKSLVLLLLLMKTCAPIHLVGKVCDASSILVTVQLHISSCAMTGIIIT